MSTTLTSNIQRCSVVLVNCYNSYDFPKKINKNVTGRNVFNLASLQSILNVFTRFVRNSDHMSNSMLLVLI